MTATVRVGVLMPFDAPSLALLELFGCGVYLEFITVAERNQCLAGQGITVQTLRDRYPANVAEIDAQILNGSQRPFADAATPTVKSYYCGNYDIDNLHWGRIQGWLAAQTDKWIRCNHDGDVIEFDEAGSEISNMPAPGTNIATVGGMLGLFALSGFVPWTSGSWGGDILKAGR